MGQTLRFNETTSDPPRIRYAEQGSAGGEAVVLLHGYTDSWYSFSRVLPLCPPDWHAIAPDMRGHGGSEAAEDGYGINDLASDVIRVLDGAGIEQATLVGHCMGSFVARRVAAAYPQRVRRLVLAASAPTPRNQALAEFAAQVSSLTSPISRSFVRDFQAGTIAREVPPEFFEQVVANSFGVPVYVWKRALAGLMAYEARQDLGAIGCPTLILCGEHDSVFSVREHVELVEAIRQSRLEVSARAGHSWHWEDPEDFVRRVASWMSAAVRKVPA